MITRVFLGFALVLATACMPVTVQAQSACRSVEPFTLTGIPNTEERLSSAQKESLAKIGEAAASLGCRISVVCVVAGESGAAGNTFAQGQCGSVRAALMRFTQVPAEMTDFQGRLSSRLLVNPRTTDLPAGNVYLMFSD